MAGKFRGLDLDVGWIKREFADIKRQLRELAAAKKLQASTIGTGTVNIDGDGRLVAGAGNAIGEPLAVLDATGMRVATVDTDGTTIAPPVVVIFNDEIRVDDGVNAGKLRMDGSGAFQIYSSTNQVLLPVTTTGSAANARLDTVGANSAILKLVTSSRRYKQDIEGTDVDPAAVLKMQPRTWRDKAEVEADPNTERRYVGFIAEELDDLGLGQFVEYDDEGPEAIAYDRLSVALLAVLKDQDARLEALEKAAESKDKG